MSYCGELNYNLLVGREALKFGFGFERWEATLKKPDRGHRGHQRIKNFTQGKLGSSLRNVECE